jgi:polyphosphate kinase 2 (PPK2 family)
MFDQVDLDRSVAPDIYKQRLPQLQNRLFAAEQAVLEANVPVAIVFEGWAGTAKIGTIGQITRRLDPRGVRVYPITAPRTLETQFPWLYRFWLKIPSYGQVAIFDRSWYREVLAARTRNGLSTNALRARCEDIAVFERQLADDGTILLKFWLHISRAEQEARFRKLLKDPLTAWQVTDEDRWQQRHYKRVACAAEDLTTRTDLPYAPWLVLPATDPRFTTLAVLEAILARVEAALGVTLTSDALNGDELNGLARPDFDKGSVVFFRPRATTDAVEVAHSQTPSGQASNEHESLVARPEAGILARVDRSLCLDEKTYERKLARKQAKLGILGFRIYQQKRPVIVVFEGWDAAGKGGAIQRITAALDPRGYVVHAIAAPSGEDKAHHYLYRFWRRLPPAGSMAIFDRSWYGRVLVERVEGFARREEWQRAYAEINEFERQLVDYGAILCKFWLHISPEEQLRRFEERKNVAYKAWKLTEEDWRNRAKWKEYEQAADEMLSQTTTPSAPWTVVEAEDKRYARIKVLRTLVKRLEGELGKVKL